MEEGFSVKDKTAGPSPAGTPSWAAAARKGVRQDTGDLKQGPGKPIAQRDFISRVFDLGIAV